MWAGRGIFKINVMTTPEIASFIQRLMRRELCDGELSALTTRDLDDINTYLGERAKAKRESLLSSSQKTQTSVQQGVQQRIETVQHSLQKFKNARTYSENEILQELGSDPLA